MLFSEQLLAMLSSKMALCTLTKIFWKILDNSSVFVCFCGGYRTLSHNPISFTLVISKINGERLPWALPLRRTARPPRSARVPVCTRSDIFPWCFHCLSTLETRGTKKNRINLEHRAFSSSRRFLASASDLKVEDNRTWEKTQQSKLGIQRWCFSKYKLVHHQFFTIFWCFPKFLFTSRWPPRHQRSAAFLLLPRARTSRNLWYNVCII